MGLLKINASFFKNDYALSKIAHNSNEMFLTLNSILEPRGRRRRCVCVFVRAHGLEQVTGEDARSLCDVTPKFNRAVQVKR